MKRPAPKSHDAGATPTQPCIGLPTSPQIPSSNWIRWSPNAMSALLTAVILIAPSASHAQARPYDSTDRIEIINESIATPPAIDREQLKPARPVQPAASPNSAEAAYLRQLEQYANAATGTPPRALANYVRTPADAAWLLGLMNLHGIGTGLNPIRAREWFIQAQKLRHPLAPAGIAWCFLDGCGQQADAEKALPWIVQLRKTDAARALYLEWLRSQLMAPLQVATPSKPEVESKMPSALLLKAVKAGDTYAENELGIYYAENGQLEQARRLFQLAAKSSPAAQANLELITRQSQEKNQVKTARQPQSGQELFLRARQFHRGDGVPVNYAEALRLYRQAATSGNPYAQKMLALLYTQPTPTGDLNIVWMKQLANVDVTQQGGTVMLEPPPPPILQHDPSPLFDFLPARLRPANRDAGNA